MNKFWTILLIAFVFIITGCSSTDRITSLNTKPNEAIILAKIQIRNGDSFLDNKWNFLLDERLWAKWAAWPDEQNYIYMKVPLGKHFIALLQHKEFRLNIPDNYLSIDTQENKIYYIGDIVLNWTIDQKKDLANNLNGAMGAITDAKKSGEYIEVEINDNFNETTKYFNSKFQNNQSIEKELLNVNK